MNLNSAKPKHAIIIRLDKNNPREKALREFLDDCENNGINRKEVILKLFEGYNSSDFIKMDLETPLKEEGSLSMEQKHSYRFSGRFKKDASKNVLDFVKLQYEEGNFNDAILYLIEKEVYENGIRNLSHNIPSIRTSNYFENLSESIVVNSNNTKYSRSKIEKPALENKKEVEKKKKKVPIMKTIKIREDMENIKLEDFME